MNPLKWLKSYARKKGDELAAEAEAKRQAEIAIQQERQRQYDAEVAAASTPEKLKETGTALLIELIRTYPYVQVADNMYFGKKWRFGNIELNSFYYIVEYHEGLKSTYLFTVPPLRHAAVKKALDIRYRQLGGRNYIPVSDITPVAAEVSRFKEKLKANLSGMEKNEADKQEEAELRQYRRDMFMRLARETLQKNK